ncbi:hypothetical protein ACFV9G_17475 [Nocardioides sp. NPDC059952]|uniref:hypothetical protein n=1 Tax=Nocardioides sp. NPDC059952 TaxID=3347014 RepID=UPI00365A41A9
MHDTTWYQRDRAVTIETTAGDLEVADPIEVAQYGRWAEALTSVALTGQAAADRDRDLTRDRGRSASELSTPF